MTELIRESEPASLTPTPPTVDAVGPVRRIIRRRPLTVFFVLSCVLSWWAGGLYLVGMSPAPIAGFGPFLAALVVLSATTGRAGVRQLLRDMLRWRVPLRGYVAALGLPVLISGTAVVANIALGADWDTAAATGWTEIPITLLLILLIPGLGGAWEEPGFRGYALPRLERRFGPLTGPLVLGVLWVLWHGPLFLAGQIPVADVFTIVAASVVIAAVFHSARDSVFIAMLLHATNNAVGGNFASQLFHGGDSSQLGVLTAVGWWLAASVIILRQLRTARGGDQKRADHA